jgi:hypothetical protein
MRHNTLPLVNLQPGEFIYFSCYAAVGLVPPVSSFLFTLLEFYGLQLQHLSHQSLVLVVIFSTSVRYLSVCDRRSSCFGCST